MQIVPYAQTPAQPNYADYAQQATSAVPVYLANPAAAVPNQFQLQPVNSVNHVANYQTVPTNQASNLVSLATTQSGYVTTAPVYQVESSGYPQLTSSTVPTQQPVESVQQSVPSQIAGQAAGVTPTNTVGQQGSVPVDTTVALVNALSQAFQAAGQGFNRQRQGNFRQGNRQIRPQGNFGAVRPQNATNYQAPTGGNMIQPLSSGQNVDSNGVPTQPMQYGGGQQQQQQQSQQVQSVVLPSGAVFKNRGNIPNFGCLMHRQDLCVFHQVYHRYAQKCIQGCQWALNAQRRQSSGGGFQQRQQTQQLPPLPAYPAIAGQATQQQPQQTSQPQPSQPQQQTQGN